MSKIKDEPKPTKTGVTTPLVTKTAKDFVKDSNKSSDYSEAVDSTVSLVVAAIGKKIAELAKKSRQVAKSNGNH